MGGGGLRLLELSLRETEDELKDLDREREREREPEAEEEPEYDEEPDIDPDGLARRGLPDLAMPLQLVQSSKPYLNLTQKNRARKPQIFELQIFPAEEIL